ARVSALELGSGVGLVAMTAALLGWEFVASDKADVLPLLELNVKRCVSSTKRESLLCLCKSSPRVSLSEHYREKNAVFVKFLLGSGAGPLCPNQVTPRLQSMH
ncbi:unnamed protein product, partial [Ectocarpus sp. 8 AP-2014]